MDLTIDCSEASVTAINSSMVRVHLSSIDEQDLNSQSGEIAQSVGSDSMLGHFDLDEVISKFGKMEILDHIGEDEAREHFGIEDE